MMDDPVPIEIVTLEWLRQSLRQTLPTDLVDQMEIKTWHDELYRRIMVEFRWSVLAERLPPDTVTAVKEFTYRVPATWWQYFKDAYALRWWLRWLVRRRPVTWTTHRSTAQVTVDCKRFYVYPEAKVMPSDLGQHVRVMTMDPPRWLWDKPDGMISSSYPGPHWRRDD